MKVLLLHRAEEFSPNNVAKDALLLDAVERRLVSLGHDATHLREEELTFDALAPFDVVVSMARRFSSLILLERSGKRVINAPGGVRRALSRETTLELLSAAGVPVPRYWSYDPDADEMFLCEPHLQTLLPGWVKGMHPRGVCEGDVQYVVDAMAADSRVITLAAEGYADIVVTEHLPGSVVKVYCVGSEPVHWMLPQLSGYTKFGDEAHNDLPASDALPDVSRLSTLAAAIASAMQLQFFGFDAIVGPEGQLRVIDVNDAPSFSPCRELAAERICQLL